jgi:hypothetical protein
LQLMCAAHGPFLIGDDHHVVGEPQEAPPDMLADTSPPTPPLEPVIRRRSATPSLQRAAHSRVIFFGPPVMPATRGRDRYGQRDLAGVEPAREGLYLAASACRGTSDPLAAPLFRVMQKPVLSDLSQPRADGRQRHPLPAAQRDPGSSADLFRSVRHEATVGAHVDPLPLLAVVHSGWLRGFRHASCKPPSMPRAENAIPLVVFDEVLTAGGLLDQKPARPGRSTLLRRPRVRRSTGFQCVALHSCPSARAPGHALTGFCRSRIVAFWRR